ncbi:DUF4190 domain-containing protein [Micromonospora krabiensis]|uniref:DUF4190 domain-containing protein n=1 Tax=Micromonospora krabiensis TaxID=307121 RepID=A0A1C3N6L4_9ACTN|nr:DUF4190 domain-containing protein [Micromonospora krabiensis]SBV28193.1 protein of unknown function [Micromonospora krabiensis]
MTNPPPSGPPDPSGSEQSPSPYEPPRGDQPPSPYEPPRAEPPSPYEPSGDEAPPSPYEPSGERSPYAPPPGGSPFGQPGGYPPGSQWGQQPPYAPQGPYGQYGPPPPVGPGSPTNVLAILSLIFAFVFPPAGAVLGHLAKRQLKTSGEAGDQLATWGLILGYVFTGLGLLVCCGWIALLAFAGTDGSGTGY